MKKTVYEIVELWITDDTRFKTEITGGKVTVELYLKSAGIVFAASASVILYHAMFSAYFEGKKAMNGDEVTFEISDPRRRDARLYVTIEHDRIEFHVQYVPEDKKFDVCHVTFTGDEAVDLLKYITGN